MMNFNNILKDLNLTEIHPMIKLNKIINPIKLMIISFKMILKEHYKVIIYQTTQLIGDN